MNKTSTMEMDFIISKSNYLQRLLLSLPEHKLRDVLISPREEFIQRLKWHLRVSVRGDHQSMNQ